MCQRCRLPDSSLQPVHGESLSPVLTFTQINVLLSTLHYITSVFDDNRTHTHTHTDGTVTNQYLNKYVHIEVLFFSHTCDLDL